jgi:hypothetical protein
MQPRQSLVSGDVVFNGLSFDIRSLSEPFKQRFTLRSFCDFTLRLKQFNKKGWITVFTDEIVATGSTGHFEMIYTHQMQNMLLGVVDGHEPFSYKSHIGEGEGKSMYVNNMSLYATQHSISDALEFKFVKVKNNDRVGLFFDMREPNNGRMFLTHEGQICGQMFKNLQSPARPAISYSSNLVRGNVEIATVNKCPLPNGWNDLLYRQDDYLATRSERYTINKNNVHS